MEGFCDRLVGMHRVAVTGERSDLHSVCLDGVFPLFKSSIVVKENCGIAVCLSGVSSAAYLNCLDTELFKFCKRLVEREVCKEVCKYSKFHFCNPFLSYILFFSGFCLFFLEDLTYWHIEEYVVDPQLRFGRCHAIQLDLGESNGRRNVRVRCRRSEVICSVVYELLV